MRPAVFLDRDNTIIHNDGDLGDATAVRLIAGAAGAMRDLSEAGYALIIITNQSGVARGVFTEVDVQAVHKEVRLQLAQASGREDLVLAWYYCPWHPEGVIEAFRGSHPWRKPEPGMVLAAAADHELDLAKSWVVGDQERDVEAGLRAGCRAIRLGPPSTSTTAETCVPTLVDAAAYIQSASN